LFLGNENIPFSFVGMKNLLNPIINYPYKIIHTKYIPQCGMPHKKPKTTKTLSQYFMNNVVRDLE
jgi:hypothetical protein